MTDSFDILKYFCQHHRVTIETVDKNTENAENAIPYGISGIYHTRQISRIPMNSSYFMSLFSYRSTYMVFFGFRLFFFLCIAIVMINKKV